MRKRYDSLTGSDKLSIKVKVHGVRRGFGTVLTAAYKVQKPHHSTLAAPATFL